MVQRAIVSVRTASTVPELRIAQAIVLTEVLGLPAESAAVAVGRNREWVSRARAAFASEDRSFGASAAGGRRNQLFSSQKELELVKRAITQRRKAPWGTTLRSVLREIVDQESGEVVAESTLSGIMRRAASQLLPGGRVWELEYYSQILADMIRLESRLKELRRRN